MKEKLQKIAEEIERGEYEDEQIAQEILDETRLKE